MILVRNGNEQEQAIIIGDTHDRRKNADLILIQNNQEDPPHPGDYSQIRKSQEKAIMNQHKIRSGRERDYKLKDNDYQENGGSASGQYDQLVLNNSDSNSNHDDHII